MSKVLIIGSDPNIINHIPLFLENSGFDVLVTNDGASGLQKTMEFLPDIILCNADLPNRHGYEVFKELQQNISTATIPFILLMDNASIQNIREAMNLGIDDCLIKPLDFDELSELIKTRINKKQRIIDDRNKKVQTQEQYLRTILKTTRDGFWILNSKGQIIDVNDTYCKMSGFSKDEILQRTIKDQDALENDDETKARMQRIKENGSELFKTRHWRKDRTVFDLEISVTYMDIQGGQYICFCRDITPQKRAEKELANYASMLDLAPSAITIHNLEGNFLYSNQKNLQLHGYTDDEFRKLSIHDLDVPESRELIEQRIEKIEKEGEAAFDVKHYKKDGSIIPLLLYVKKIDWNGTSALLSIGTDITEHKKAQSTLKESEAKYRQIAENISDVVWTTDLNLKTTFISPSIKNLTGEKPEEHLKRKFEERYSPKSLKKIQSIFKEELDGEKDPKVDKNRTRIVELQQYHANGTLLWVSVNVSFIRDENGNPIGVQGVTRDITKRKQAELELKQSNQKNKAILEALPDLIFVLSKDGVYLDYYASKTDNLLMPPEHFLNRKDRDVLPAYLAETNQKTLKKLFKTGKAQNYSYTLEMNGKTMYFDARMVKLDEKRALSIVRNITERKKAEEELHSNYALLQIAGETARFGGWSVDLENNITTWSDAVADIHEVPHGYVPTVQEAFNFYAPEWHDKITQVFDDCTQKGIPYDEEMEIITSKGKRLWVRTNAMAIKDETGKIIKVQGSFQDITERKMAEKSLQESEEKMRSIYRVAPTGIGLVVNRKLKEVNPLVCEMTGYSREELIEKNAQILYPSKAEYEFVGKEKYEQIRKNGTGQVETIWQKKDGTIIHVLMASTPIDKNDFSKGVTFTALDITERKKSEETLRKSEEMLRNSQSLANISSYSTNLNVHAIEKSQWVCSPEFYKIFGIDETYPHTIEGWIALIHPDYREEVAAYHKSVVKERKSFQHEYKIIRNNDGAERWVYGTGELELDKKGNPVRMHGAIQDITDRKQVELALRESEERFRYLFRDIHTVAVQGYKFDGTTTYWNKASESLYGFTSEEAIGRNLLDLIIPSEMQDNVRNEMRLMYESGKAAQASEMSLKRKDGTRISVFSSHAIVQRHNHEPELFCLDIDISESKQAEEALRKSEAIKNKMVSNIGDVIVIIDKNGINRYKSPNIEKLFGWKPEELTGKNVFDIVHPEDLSRVQKFVDKLTMKRNASGTAELRYKRKDGKYVWIEITAVNLFHDRDIKGIMGNYHDISDRKNAEQELIAAKKKAEESDQLKSAFLANMSHEIRTPMNAIRGFSQLMVEVDFPKEKQQKFLEIINTRTKDLLVIIDDIIDISKIEANQLNIIEQEFSLNNLLSEVYADKESEFENNTSLKFNLEIDLESEDNDIIISADRSRLKQVFLNLINNAKKFTSEGIISFGYDMNKNNELECYVRDTGIGIPTGAQRLIFERFRQVDGSSTRKYGGTGLGLNICKQILKLMGGDIWVKSEEGKGSTFFFTVPYKPVKKKINIPMENETYEWSNKNVLIVEDDHVSLYYLCELLEQTNVKLLKAHDRNEAMEHLRKNKEIDLILLDINLPEVDGNEVVKEIRKKNKTIPVIAQSAYSMEKEIKDSMKYGFNDYITKPIDSKRLFSIMNKYLGKGKKASS